MNNNTDNFQDPPVRIQHWNPALAVADQVIIGNLFTDYSTKRSVVRARNHAPNIPSTSNLPKFTVLAPPGNTIDEVYLSLAVVSVFIERVQNDPSLNHLDNNALNGRLFELKIGQGNSSRRENVWR